jgi:hypothetical protein
MRLTSAAVSLPEARACGRAACQDEQRARCACARRPPAPPRAPRTAQPMKPTSDGGGVNLSSPGVAGCAEDAPRQPGARQGFHPRRAHTASAGQRPVAAAHCPHLRGRERVLLKGLAEDHLAGEAAIDLMVQELDPKRGVAARHRPHLARIGVHHQAARRSRGGRQKRHEHAGQQARHGTLWGAGRMEHRLPAARDVRCCKLSTQLGGSRSTIARLCEAYASSASRSAYRHRPRWRPGGSSSISRHGLAPSPVVRVVPAASRVFKSAAAAARLHVALGTQHSPCSCSARKVRRAYRPALEPPGRHADWGRAADTQLRPAVAR